MKKNLMKLATLLIALCMVPALALGDVLSDMMDSVGLTDAQKLELQEIAGEAAEKMTDEEIRMIVDAYLASTLEKSEGVLEDGVYSIDGISFAVPQNWQIAETQGAATVVLMGQERQGVAPVISIAVTAGEQAELDIATKEDWDEQYAAFLQDFESDELETLTFHEATAHKYIFRCTQNGIPTATYQLYFNRDGFAYLFALTTATETDAQTEALSAYNALLASLTFAENVG